MCHFLAGPAKHGKSRAGRGWNPATHGASIAVPRKLPVAGSRHGRKLPSTLAFSTGHWPKVQLSGLPTHRCVQHLCGPRGSGRARHSHWLALCAGTLPCWRRPAWASRVQARFTFSGRTRPGRCEQLCLCRGPVCTLMQPAGTGKLSRQLLMNNAQNRAPDIRLHAHGESRLAAPHRRSILLRSESAICSTL